MKTRFFILIGILVTGYFLSGCDEEVKRDAPEKYIYVNKSSLDIFYGDTVQLKANPVGETFEWTSADPAIATVTSDGLVEAVGVGSTEIIAGQGMSQTAVPVNVTVPTADKVVVAGANGRFQIAVQTLSDRIATVRAYWNNEQDSIDIAVNNQIGIFTRTVDYSGENGYFFHVVSIDKFGNESVPVETTATLLRNRDVTTAQTMDDGSLTIQWGDNVQYVDHCKLSYVNLNGQTVSQKVSPSETTTVISDYSSDLSYTTLFMLIPSTTDTFRVETVSVAIAGILNMDEWTVTASSYEASGGEYGTPDVILINGFEKVWHTRFSGSTAQPPHWIEIDMQNLKQLTRIEITRHTDIKALHIITSETQITDKNSLGDLSPIATLEYPAPWNLKDIMLSRDFENPVSAQYIYFHIPSGHRIYASIQFIKAFGWTQ